MVIQCLAHETYKLQVPCAECMYTTLMSRYMPLFHTFRNLGTTAKLNSLSRLDFFVINDKSTISHAVSKLIYRYS